MCSSRGFTIILQRTFPNHTSLIFYFWSTVLSDNLVFKIPERLNETTPLKYLYFFATKRIPESRTLSLRYTAVLLDADQFTMQPGSSVPICLDLALLRYLIKYCNHAVHTGRLLHKYLYGWALYS